MIRLVQRRLIIPRGDTGTFSVPVLSSLNTGDAAIFTIIDSSTNTKIFSKKIEDFSEVLTVHFNHTDTVNLPVGKYYWDIKFYKNPVFADGELIDGEEVDSYYAAFSLPACEIKQTGDKLLTADDAPNTTLTAGSLNIISAAVTEAVAAKQAALDATASIVENMDSKADKTDTVLETTLSRGRKENTTVGNMSFAFGSNVEASGPATIATGSSTIASGICSRAEGFFTIASGSASHAEGYETQALKNNSHAEGSTTIANGTYSHAEGYMSQVAEQGAAAHAEGFCTIAGGRYQHASGSANVEDSPSVWPEWVADTYYNVGDKVKVTNDTNFRGYICKTANNDSTFTSNKWTFTNGKGIYIDIVGNGSNDDNRSNAYALDWDGNGHYMGDVYVGANADSSGGEKLAKVSDLTSKAETSYVNETFVKFTDYPQTNRNTAGVVKVDSAGGLMADANGLLSTYPATGTVIKNGADSYQVITPKRQHISVFYGLAKAAGYDEKNASIDNFGTYSSEAKAAIQTMLGVPVVPSWALAQTKPTYTAAEVGATTTSDVNSLISLALNQVNSFDTQLVQELPTQNISTHTVYFVPKTGSSNDAYDEYMYLNGSWEKVGNTSVDLSNYVQKTDYATNSQAGVVKASSATGININNEGFLYVTPPTTAEIKAATDTKHSVTPSTVKEAVFYGLAKSAGDTTQSQSNNSVGTYTNEAKTSIRNMLGVPATTDIPSVPAWALASNKPSYTANEVGAIANTAPAASITSADISNWNNTINGELIAPVEESITATRSYNIGDLFIYDNKLYKAAAAIAANSIITENVNCAEVNVNDEFARKADTILSTSLSRGRKASTANGTASFAFGQNVTASGEASFAIGTDTVASNQYAFASGLTTSASGKSAHAEGSETVASGTYTHAEGYQTTASGTYSHAEGRGTQASGSYSHAESANTQAVGNASHAEGSGTYAIGHFSHAEGQNTTASGKISHAEGYYSVANGRVAHAQGKYNVVDTLYPDWVANTSYQIGDKVVNNDVGFVCITPNSDSEFNALKWNNIINTSDNALIVGNGTSTIARSNAYALTWTGDGKYAGDVYVHSNTDSTGGTKVATITDLESKAPAIYKTLVNQTTATFNDAAQDASLQSVIVKLEASQDDSTGAISGVSDASVIVSSTNDAANGTTYSKTFTDPATVYGGTYDFISGTLTITHAIKNLGDANWNTTNTNTDNKHAFISQTLYGFVKYNNDGNDTIANILCSDYDIVTVNDTLTCTKGIALGPNYTLYVYDEDYATANTATFKEAMNGVEVLYELSHPTVVQLESSRIMPLNGTTNIWTVDGTVDVTYAVDTKAYADTKADKKDTVLESTLSRGRYANSTVGGGSLAFGSNVIASGFASQAVGSYSTSSGAYSHAEGMGTRAIGIVSHSEGYFTTASGESSHAEGTNIYAGSFKLTGEENATTYSYTPSRPISVGDRVSKNGIDCKIITAIDKENQTLTLNETLGIALNNVNCSLIIGSSSGRGSHSEGANTTASNNASHSEGTLTIASGSGSHSEGRSTEAASQYQHVQGKYNIVDSNNVYADIVGNGTSNDIRSNAFALDWSGNGYYAGDVYVGANADSTGGTKLAKLTDLPNVPVQDVQINGTSILDAQGVAEIPIASADQFNNSPGLVKIFSGKGFTTDEYGHLVFNVPQEITIKRASSAYNPISPSNQHISTFYGLSKVAGVDLANETVTLGTYPETSKTAIRNMLGAVGDVQVNGTSVTNNGVANIPVANENTYGVVKTDVYVNGNGYEGGIATINGKLYSVGGNDNAIKSGVDLAKPVAAGNQHKAVFYGLAKAAGADMKDVENVTIGTYPDAQKTAIHTMLGIDPASIAAQVEIPLVETVTGTTPTITGQPNTCYNCGEVTSISITPPSSGTIDVFFTSGSTPALLTVPASVKFPAWFNSAALEANTTYEILITNGVYGSVMSWAA